MTIFAPIKIPSFITNLLTYTYDPGVMEAVLKEQIDSKTPLIMIDLTNNGGGDPSKLAHLLSFFLKSDTLIGSSVTRDAWENFSKTPEYNDLIKSSNSKKVDQKKLNNLLLSFLNKKYLRLQLRVPDYSRKEEELFKGYVAVLVNNFTACAAEITALALRDFLGKKCVIIGQNTLGKTLGAFGNFKGLQDTFHVSYPFIDYLSSKGERIENNPIKPDIELTPGEGLKTYIDTAIKWLKSKL